MCGLSCFGSTPSTPYGKGKGPVVERLQLRRQVIEEGPEPVGRRGAGFVAQRRGVQIGHVGEPGPGNQVMRRLTALGLALMLAAAACGGGTDCGQLWQDINRATDQAFEAGTDEAYDLVDEMTDDYLAAGCSL